jgi:hypothetical protein
LARSCSTSNSTAFAFIPPATTSARASTSIVDDDATLTVVGGFGDINDILNACGGVIDALRTVIVVVVVVVSLCLAARVSASSIICVDLNVPIPPCPTLTGVRTSSSSSPSPTITKLFLVADVVAIVVANLRALASARLAVSLIFILDALVSVSTRIFRADARADDITRSASDRTVVARAPLSRTGVTGSSFSSTFVSSSRSRGVDSSRARASSSSSLADARRARIAFDTCSRTNFTKASSSASESEDAAPGREGIARVGERRAVRSVSGAATGRRATRDVDGPGVTMFR